MKTCDSCKWWAGDHPFSRRQESPKFRECQCPQIDTENKPAIGEYSAFAAAGDYYAAIFSTGPTFGCVHWEGKE